MEPRLLRRGNGEQPSRMTARSALQWSHAFSDVETIGQIICPPTPHRFNGATPSQTWKHSHRRGCAGLLIALQWSHAFSDVETRHHLARVAMWVKASMEPRLLRRGNVAPRLVRPLNPLASMEPRLLRRGNDSYSAGQSETRRASMEPRLLRRGNASGAALLTLPNELQWSHAFSDVETCPTPNLPASQ